MAYITIQEAARRLSVSTSALYFALNQGHLTRHEQYGRILLDEDEVSKYEPRAYKGRPGRRVGGRPAKESEATS